jgi:hypothetical protein
MVQVERLKDFVLDIGDAQKLLTHAVSMGWRNTGFFWERAAECDGGGLGKCFLT